MTVGESYERAQLAAEPPMSNAYSRCERELHLALRALYK